MDANSFPKEVRIEFKYKLGCMKYFFDIFDILIYVGYKYTICISSATLREEGKNIYKDTASKLEEKSKK